MGINQRPAGRYFSLAGICNSNWSQRVKSHFCRFG